MRLRSRQFEKRLRHLLRARVAASPRLRAEKTRARRQFQTRVPGWFWGLLFAIGLPIAFVVKLPDANLFGVTLTLWASLLALVHAAGLQSALFRSPALVVFAILPISPPGVCSVQGRSFLRSTPWSLISLLTLYVVGSLRTNLAGPVFWIGLGLVIVPWLLALWGAVVLMRFAPRWPYGLVHLGVFLLILLWGVGGERVREGFAAALASAGPPLEWVLPAGWARLAFQHGFVQGETTMLGLLVPAGLVLATLPACWNSLRKRYVPPEIESQLESGDDANGEETLATPTDAELAAAPRVSRTEMSENLRSKDWSTPPDWHTYGRIEGLLGRCFDNDERRILDFMLGGSPHLTARLRGAGVLLGLGVIAVLIFSQHRELLALLFGGGALLIVSPVAGGGWRGLDTRAIFGLRLPLYALFPVSYREFERVFLKLNLLRCLVVAPLAVALGAVGFWLAGMPVEEGVWMGLKVVMAILLWQPTVLAFRISNCTNDTSGAPLFVIVCLLFILLLLGLTIGFLFVPEPGWDLIAGVGAAAISWVFGRLYRWRYERTGFDLVTLADNHL